MSKEVVLVSPNTLGSYKFSGKPRENLALSCLGGYLTQKGVNNELVDARLDSMTVDEVASEVKKIKPAVVGLTFMWQDPAIWSKNLVDTIKEESPSTHVVAGGYFPTLDPKKCFEILPKLDSIVQGEGEETLLELVLKVKNKEDWFSTKGVVYKDSSSPQLRLNPRRSLIKNIDTLPEPIRYANGDRVSKIALEGSRGCFSHCTFCSINPHLNPEKSTWRGKSPQKIVTELVNLRTRYPNVDQFRFVDADFIGLGKDYKRLEILGQELIKAGFSSNNSKIFVETQSVNALTIPPNVWELLHKAGLYQVFVGVETGSKREKKYLAKTSTFEDDIKAIGYLKSFGFNVTYGFIMINPWSNLEDIHENIKALGLLGNAGLDKYFSELVLSPGTRAFDLVNQENNIYIEKVEGVDYYSYPLPEPIENIRRIGRFMLESREYRPFLERTAKIYGGIDKTMMNQPSKNFRNMRKELDQINLSIFMEIMNKISSQANLFEQSKIESLLRGIISNYWERVSSIEQRVYMVRDSTAQQA